jgi:hypothetical protein
MKVFNTYIEFYLYEKCNNEFAIIIFSGAFWIRALFGIYLLDSQTSDLKTYVTLYLDLLFIRFKLLRIET